MAHVHFVTDAQPAALEVSHNLVLKSLSVSSVACGLRLSTSGKVFSPRHRLCSTSVSQLGLAEGTSVYISHRADLIFLTSDHPLSRKRGTFLSPIPERSPDARLPITLQGSPPGSWASAERHLGRGWGRACGLYPVAEGRALRLAGWL